MPQPDVDAWNRSTASAGHADTPPPSRDGISRGLVLLLAVACGAAAANLYYAQPLLHTLGGAFGVSDGTAGLLITVTQVGYVLGWRCWSRSATCASGAALISGTLIITAAALAVGGRCPRVRRVRRRAGRGRAHLGGGPDRSSR